MEVEKIKEFLRLTPEGADEEFMGLWNKNIISEMFEEDLITESVFDELMDWTEDGRK